MTQPSNPEASPAFEKLSPITLWGFLVVVSALLAALFEVIGLPAALLLGPMIAGIIVGSNGGKIRPLRLPVLAAQTIVGCLVARAITTDAVVTFLKDWPLFLTVVIAIVAMSTGLGWLMTRWQVLPGTTAVWGTAPGGASVMMVMSGSFGADPRLVAFMQYLRVVLVAAVASLVARFWLGAPDAVAPDLVWFPHIQWQDFVGTLLIAAIGGCIAVGLRIPAGTMLVPLTIGAVVEGFGLVTITLPPWLLAISYAFLGWSVGLGFTREILLHASRALPQVLLAVLSMIAACGVFALLLVYAAGIDPMTAYLATSPGGMDSVAIIGASSKADLSFVMALQTLRLVIVILCGPPLAKFIAQRIRTDSGRRC
jgi:membrane AbrB-like protein